MKYQVEEAVARFFPHGAAGYDHAIAKRFIAWMSNCGYAIVPKDEVNKEQPPQTLKDAA